MKQSEYLSAAEYLLRDESNSSRYLIDADPKIKENEEYWKRYLVDIPDVHSLSLDGARTGNIAPQHAKIQCSINKKFTKHINIACDHYNVDTLIYLETVISILIARFSSSKDIVVGVRDEKKFGKINSEQSMGFIPLRSQFTSEVTFEKLLLSSQSSYSRSLSHIRIPVNSLLQVTETSDTLNAHPVFQVGISYVTVEEPDVSLNNSRGVQFSFGNDCLSLDMLLIIYNKQDVLQCEWYFDAQLFNESTVKRKAESFLLLLEDSLLAPEKNVNKLNIIPDNDLRLLKKWNNTSKPASEHERCYVYELFEEQTSLSPDNIAILDSSRYASYRELNQHSNQLAHHLLAEGLGSGDRIGIFIDQSFEYIVAILSALKAHCTYIPIDPKLPEERIRYLLSDAEIKYVLTTGSESVLPLTIQQCCCFSVDYRSYQQYPKTNLDLEHDTGSELPAYVIYTSGSTGLPKGVIVTHRSLLNLAFYKRATFGLNSSDCVLQFASVGFDAAVSEWLMTLSIGARLSVIPSGRKIDIDQFTDHIADTGVTCATLPPIFLQTYPLERLRKLKTLIVAGEEFPPQLANTIREVLPEVRLFNAYGPTEGAVCSTCFKVETEIKKSVPIGKPIQNVQCFVLNECGEMQPVGAFGELCIAGENLAVGYFNDTLTNEKFTTVTIQSTPILIYRTGDLVRWLPDGNLEYGGRIDDQIKIHGVRIEPREIEYQLSCHELIKDSCVVSRSMSKVKHARALVAYVVLYNQETVFDNVLQNDIISFLKQRLPEYMVPAAITNIPRIPQTNNGKLDKKKLPDIFGEASAPNTDFQRLLYKIWKDTLGITGFSITDNFFALGGDSIKAQIFLIALNKHGYEIPLDEFYRKPTIKGCAAIYGTSGGSRLPDVYQECLRFKATNLQSKMLFQSLTSQHKAINIEQFALKIDSYNKHKLIATLEKLASIHGLLRATISITKTGIYFNTDNTAIIDCHFLPFSEKFDLDDAMSTDAELGFDVLNCRLVRVKVYWCKTHAYAIFSFHHAIIDGWCQSLFIQDFWRLYKGDEKTISRLISYGGYVERMKSIANEKEDESKEFWKDHLSNFISATKSVIEEKFSHKKSFESHYITKPLRHDLIVRLNQSAKTHLVSIHSLFLYAWSQTLSDFEQTDCVDFLQAVSVRPTTINAIDRLLGLCINLVPNQIKITENNNLVSAIKSIDQSTNELVQYGYEDIEKIRRYADLPAHYERKLWSLFVFQNFPSLPENIQHTLVKSRWYSTQPFTIIVFPKGRSRIEVAHKTSLIDRNTADFLLESYMDTLERVSILLTINK
ncbi:non-ribosomal peptide synthetase [Teredinibacter turnerae]|uniref:non-ribosomal peptide synthetase n=1 Tax=Teredinibacter turnerae TaxID=2426 RepID=UPI000372BF03|nr:non-ribosomal peptide synthetase [Teredinibacter turnerae]